MTALMLKKVSRLFTLYLTGMSVTYYYKEVIGLILSPQNYRDPNNEGVQSYMIAYNAVNHLTQETNLFDRDLTYHFIYALESCDDKSVVFGIDWKRYSGWIVNYSITLEHLFLVKICSLIGKKVYYRL